MLLQPAQWSAFFSQTQNSAYAVSQRHFFEGLILFLLAIYLLVDTANGLFISLLSLPNGLSAAFKQGLLALVLLFALQFEPKRFFWCMVFIFIVFTWAIFRFFLVDNVWFLYAFQEAIKVIYLFVLVLVLSTFQIFTLQKLRVILLTSIAVVWLNIFFSLIGIGLTTYNDFGAKGFFYAGNAVSGIIVVTSAFILMRAFPRSIWLFAFWTLLLCATALLVGTKSGVLGVLVLALGVMLVNLNAKTVLYGALLILAFVTAIVLLFEQLQQHPTYEHILFMYDTGGFTRVILSDRDLKLFKIWPYIVNADIPQLLLGLDYGVLSNQAGDTRAEMDWFDMQVNFGAILSCVVYLGYVAIFARLMALPKNYVVWSAIAAFVVLLMVSAIAGHVLYNGMVTPIWAILTAAAFNHNIQNQFRHLDVSTKEPGLSGSSKG